MDTKVKEAIKELGRIGGLKGGHSTSPAKVAAARANLAKRKSKGGRPPGSVSVTGSRAGAKRDDTVLVVKTFGGKLKSIEAISPAEHARRKMKTSPAETSMCKVHPLMFAARDGKCVRCLKQAGR